MGGPVDSPWFQRGSRRRIAEKIRYESLASSAQDADHWTFMNYGYLDLEEEPPALDPQDEPNRLCIQLYERVVRPAALANNDVVEVGCGRGGGASFLARRFLPRSTLGLDFVPGVVEFCRRRHRVERLDFRVGDAEHIPLDPGSCDVVVNVESSHCYASMERFLASVATVLRPGGQLAWADIRPSAEVDLLRSQVRGSGLVVVEQQDISRQVLAALTASGPARLEVLRQEVPVEQQGRFFELGAFPGSLTYGWLETGEYVYIRLLLQRPAPDR
jgi:SAM-dependent methyltransferase